MKPIKSVAYKGYTIEVFYDEFCNGPDDFCLNNPVVFVCEHPRYTLGDLQQVPETVERLFDKYLPDYEGDFYDLSEGEALNLIAQTGELIYRPICMYEHSGISLWLGTTKGHMDARWDCATIGFAYAERKDFPEYGEVWEDAAGEFMEQKMMIWDAWVQGNVYECRVRDTDIMLNGYIGDTAIDRIIVDAKNEIDFYVKPRPKHYQK